MAGAPRRPAAPTVKDVARRAGVSPSTVSNVIHARATVAADIRERVRSAIEDVGYVPSSAGRQLRSGQSDLVLLALPDIRSPYYSALAHTVITRARALGLTVTVEETGGRVEHERAAALRHPNLGVAGVLICPVAMTSAELAELRSPAARVLLGEHTSGDVFDEVAIDSVAAARELTAHLIGTGRRHLAFVGTEPAGRGGPATLRLRGVRQELAAHGIDTTDHAAVSTAAVGRDDGADAVDALPVDRLDAIVCATDELAIGVLRRLRDAGIRVPEEIAVTGWDDTLEGRWSTPALTTVAHDLDAIAATALEAVLDRIADPSRPVARHTAAHRLLPRASSAPAAGSRR